MSKPPPWARTTSKAATAAAPFGVLAAAVDTVSRRRAAPCWPSRRRPLGLHRTVAVPAAGTCDLLGAAGVCWSSTAAATAAVAVADVVAATVAVAVTAEGVADAADAVAVAVEGVADAAAAAAAAAAVWCGGVAASAAVAAATADFACDAEAAAAGGCDVAVSVRPAVPGATCQVGVARRGILGARAVAPAAVTLAAVTPAAVIQAAVTLSSLQHRLGLAPSWGRAARGLFSRQRASRPFRHALPPQTQPLQPPPLQLPPLILPRRTTARGVATRERTLAKRAARPTAPPVVPLLALLGALLVNVRLLRLRLRAQLRPECMRHVTGGVCLVAACALGRGGLFRCGTGALRQPSCGFASLGGCLTWMAVAKPHFRKKTSRRADRVTPMRTWAKSKSSPQ
eukprot:365992-Chlamydomonas_euryale.AAC.5